MNKVQNETCYEDYRTFLVTAEKHGDTCIRVIEVNSSDADVL